MRFVHQDSSTSISQSYLFALNVFSYFFKHNTGDLEFFLHFLLSMLPQHTQTRH